jgi:hypothetical protein
VSGTSGSKATREGFVTILPPCLKPVSADGIEVAKDTQTSLAGSDGGLYFGAGKGLEAGTFWSGLIDDVRIYDRAVKP